jgi:hypothetical protein
MGFTEEREPCLSLPPLRSAEPTEEKGREAACGATEDMSRERGRREE